MASTFFYNLYNLHKLRKNLSSSKFEDIQAQKLQTLIKHAYTHVPYYHNLLNQAGIKPRDIQSRNDLYKIPITTKLQLQNLNIKDRIAKGVNINKCLNLRTSGSTGRPLDIFATEEEVLKSKTMAFLNMYLENGCKLTEKILRVVTPAFITKKRWFQNLGILREYFICIFDDINTQLNTFLQINPHTIRGYTSGIKSLALKFKEKNIKIQSPKIVFTTAEVLSKIDRNIISSIFKAEVIDYYCCNEAGIIAYECREHSGYHINDDNAIIECIKKDGIPCEPGEEGNILITSLNMYTMPFIRYQIGDKGIFTDTQCRCGRRSSLIKAIIGRDDDQIILPDGNVISSYLLLNIIKDIPGILEYQLVQKEKDRITINIVKDNDFSEDFYVNRIKKEYHNVLNGKIKIEPFIVKEIPKEKTGKLKVVKNEISSLGSYIPQ